MESHATYLGVELSGTRTRFHYAALDDSQRILALGSGGMDAVLAYAAGLTRGLAAVDAPSSLAGPAGGAWQVELILRRAGAATPGLPDAGKRVPAWMSKGFECYSRLAVMGYARFPVEGAALQVLETHAEGTFLSLLGRAPFEFGTLEGRIQRQLVLKDAGVNVPDAMDFFEEITRHRLLRGILPTEKIYSAGELGALAAAHVAWRAGCQPDGLEVLGAEAGVYLPVGQALHAPPPEERRPFPTLFPLD